MSNSPFDNPKYSTEQKEQMDEPMLVYHVPQLHPTQLRRMPQVVSSSLSDYKGTYMSAIIEGYQDEIEQLVDLWMEGKITLNQMMFVWHLMKLNVG